MRELKTGRYIAPEDMPTFAAVAREWLVAISKDVRLSTLAGYQTHVQMHLLPSALGALRVTEIRAGHFEAFRDRCRDKPLAPQTVNKVLGTAAMIFDYTIRQEYVEIGKNPARVAKRWRLNAEQLLLDGEVGDDAVTDAAVDPDTVLSYEEVGTLIGKASDGLYRTYLMAAAMTGARPGELTALRWTDVDLDAERLHVRASISWAKRRGAKGGAQFRRQKPKTTESRRSLPLSAQLLRALKVWKLQCPPNAGWLGIPESERHTEAPSRMTGSTRPSRLPGFARSRCTRCGQLECTCCCATQQQGWALL